MMVVHEGGKTNVAIAMYEEQHLPASMLVLYHQSERTC
jgi:hypothetical protein